MNSQGLKLFLNQNLIMPSPFDVGRISYEMQGLKRFLDFLCHSNYLLNGKCMYLVRTNACLAFNNLKIAMEAEVERAISCLEKDLDALLARAIALKKVYGEL